MESIFANISQAPPIEVFHMNKMYLDDPSKDKVNLTIGGIFQQIIKFKSHSF